MRRLTIFLNLLLISALNAQAQETDPASSAGQAVQPLFDGETLEGWEGDSTFFRVESGAIVAGTLDESIPNNVFLCTTEDYANFELRLQARLIGEGDNAGVQFRSRRVPDHHEVSGYQADMGSISRAWFNEFADADSAAESDGMVPVWGFLYDETRRNRFLAWSNPDEITDVLNAEDWNSLVVRAEGPRIQIWVNGLQTIDYTETSHIPTDGTICLQIHSGAPAEAWYRDLRLQALGGDDR